VAERRPQHVQEVLRRQAFDDDDVTVGMADADRADVEAWAASGCMALTGRPDAPPLGPPAGFVAAVHDLGTSLYTRSGVELDPLAVLAERAAVSGLTRGGDRSCGGSTRLLPAADGWLAVSLARAEDVDAVPAWLEAPPADDVWDMVPRHVAHRPVAPLIDRARLLGLPIAALGTARATVADRTVASGPPKPMADALVVDLSSLWAGPLCGHLLLLAGARVLKVESTRRPDGARRGPAPFFDLLNGGKESVALDLDDAAGVEALSQLVGRADVVIESSRPRALQQLGVAPSADQLWISITAYGRASVGVGFGDDAAVAGGLVAWDRAGPCFCADAVADPLTGLVAADLGLAALERGARGLIDVPLAAVAAPFAGPTLDVGSDLEAAPPRARTPVQPARQLGADNERVLAAR
jgi:crotonobetainyl-CoA:carnitine CoA-transferase CaiB-like acyl-CoA transferase